jgi:drug/metabolite transporter (DMT)-like permease
MTDEQESRRNSAFSPTTNAAARKPLSANNSTSLVGGIAAGLLAISIWAGWMVLTRLDLTRSALNIYDITALRFATALIVLIPFVLRHSVLPRGVSGRSMTLMVFGAGAPYALLASEGLRHAPAAHAGALIPGMMPVFAAVLSTVVLKESIAYNRVLGLVLAPIGATLIVGFNLWGNSDTLLGHALFLTASLSWAGYTVAMRRSGLKPLHVVAIVVFWSAASYLPIYLAFLPKGLSEVDWPIIGLQVIFQGVLTSVVSLIAFNFAVSRLGATRGAMLAALVPALAALLAIPVLNEWPTMSEWFGIALVTFGVLLGSGAVALRWTPRNI